ncbi:MAG: hypothetical protein QGM50_11840 [Anaerolineae bacterium]|nr:hypothetical protein [Anaerolineae bacterium]
MNEKFWLRLIFSLYFLMGLSYSLIMPMWEGPDEPAHYQIVRITARKGREAVPKNYEYHQPRGYYDVAAFAIRFLDKINPKYSDYFSPYTYYRNIGAPIRIFDWEADNYRFLIGPHILRWLNILLGGAALWVNWRTFRLIFPSEPMKILSALSLAAFTPQYLHTMSTIGNDALGTIAGAHLFYLGTRVILNRTSFLVLVSFISAIVLPLITKLTALPVAAALLCILIGREAQRVQRSRREVLIGLNLLFGSLLALLILNPEVVFSAVDQLQWRLFSYKAEAFTNDYLNSMLTQVLWSYWGFVGWLAVRLPRFLLIFLTVFGLIGGLLSVSSRVTKKTIKTQNSLWVYLWLIALFAILAVLRNGLTTIYSQGRFLFPAIGVLSLIMVNGWFDYLPQKSKRYLPQIVLILMLSVNLIFWRSGILPVYYQPFLD